MAFVLSFPFSNCSFALEKHIARRKSKDMCCYNSSVDPNVSEQSLKRRSAAYKPPIWDFEFVQSLRSTNVGEMYRNRKSKLKEQVLMMLNKHTSPLDQLEFIDNLHRLGLAPHFYRQVHLILNRLYQNCYNKKFTDLHAVSLQFRLFRQYGFQVSQEIFSDFQDEDGNFKASLNEDCKGVLSLYEASFLCEGNEDVLDAAREFTTSRLRKFVTEKQHDLHLLKLIKHALELPLHWRMGPLEARWFIDNSHGLNPLVLELAILEFNSIQQIHQSDLKYVSCWWEDSSLGGKLRFARDMIAENFLWSVGITYEPQFGSCRRFSTKIISLITIIDDIYDVYGTIDELQLFTDAIDRWDIKAIENLPHYMQICYVALYNSVNEIAYDILKEKGLYIIPNLKKVWVDLCRSYLVEAEWYRRGYIPTLEEYLENAWVSTSVHVVLVHAYFLTEDVITISSLNGFEEYPKLIRLSSIIFRLANDLQKTSDESKTGDVPKAIQCYMNDNGVSEEKSREDIHHLIQETWKEMNKEQVECSFSKQFISIAKSVVRTGNCMYKYRYGDEIEDSEVKDPVLSLLVEPISI